MGSLGEGEQDWSYNVVTNGKLVTENLNLLPEFRLDPIDSPGMFHVPNQTTESAQTVSELLQENHISYHIFLLPEHDKGVSVHHVIRHQYASYTHSHTCIITLCTMILLSGLWERRQHNCGSTITGTHCISKSLSKLQSPGQSKT